jgi:hypothetical protein
MKYYYAEKNKYLFQSYEQINFFEKYAAKLHHLRAPDPGNFEYKNVNEFIFNYINKDVSKKTLLIQGDSRTKILNDDESIQAMKDIGFIKKFNIVSAGASSYSLSPMLVQLEVLKKDFDISPNIIVVLMDPTDIGDEVCRYKPLLQYEDGKLKSLIREPNNGNIYWYDYTILGSKINLHKGLKIKYLPDLITYIVRDRIFQKKKTCGFGEIQKPLIKENKESNEYYKSLMVDYINEAFRFKELEKMYIVSYPHVQHYSEEVYGTKYITKISNIINEVLQENEHKNKITHIDFYENNIFPEMGENFFEYFQEGDHGSHLTIKANYIFSKSIFSKIK